MEGTPRRNGPPRRKGWRRGILALVGMLVLATGNSAVAAPACKNVSVIGMGFGNYDVMSPVPLDAAGSISYDCPPSLAPVIRFSRGQSSTYLPRRMLGPDALEYNVYLDASHLVIWGDGTEGTSVLNGPRGNGMTVPVYGRIPALQDVSAGSYSDTLVVTIDF